ncbi:kinase-like domain-containing protein [Mycena galopus ATCC 62051]|nr:kinase-like domain-containing protein [Mycena galopus ATCC 62051]
MAQNPDAAGIECRIFKDVIAKLQALAAIAEEMASLHMARCPHQEKLLGHYRYSRFFADACPVRGLPLEAILQLDKFFSGIPRLDTEVPPPLRGILKAVGELYTDDAGSTKGTTPLQWLSDDWAHIRLIQDLAVLRIKSAQDVASYSHEDWQLVVDKTSSEWRSVLAEMLHIQACRVGIELSVRKLCKRRLRNLAGTYGVLPFTFNVSGLKMPLHPVSGGGFSDIYKGELDKKIVCIKVLRIFTAELQLDKIYKELAREVLIWKELSHPNVLPLLGINLIVRSPSCCLVSPWMKNGNVMTFLQMYPDFNKSCLVRNIASGLEYLHDLDPPVVHGDIKGANILIDDNGHACLADFGLALAVESQVLGTSSAGSTRGTLRWLSPEILDSSRKAERQTSLTKRDIYAFGCTILEIYTGNHPFPHLQDVEIIHNVVIKHERPEIPSNAVAQLKDLHPLLKRCWQNDPRQRPSATEIGNVLRLEPLEWKGAVGGPTSPFSMWRKLSAPLGLRSPPISPAPRSHFISSTTVQSPSVIHGGAYLRVKVHERDAILLRIIIRLFLFRVVAPLVYEASGVRFAAATWNQLLLENRSVVHLFHAAVVSTTLWYICLAFAFGGLLGCSNRNFFFFRVKLSASKIRERILTLHTTPWREYLNSVAAILRIANECSKRVKEIKFSIEAERKRESVSELDDRFERPTTEEKSSSRNSISRGFFAKIVKDL